MADALFEGAKMVGSRSEKHFATNASVGTVISDEGATERGACGASAACLMAGAVTVIVVTFDSEEAIADCLAAIPGEWPVHIVDNASRDETLARIAAIDRPRLLVTRMERNEGFGRACNRALGEVATAQALLLNPDATIAPAAVARLSATMAATEGVAILAPRVVETGPAASTMRPAASLAGVFCAAHGSEADHRSLDQVLGPTACTGSGSGSTLCDVPEVNGSCMLLDVEKLRQIGFFDENLFLYYEDSDLCWRARAAGWRVCLATDEAAKHRSGDSSSALRHGELLRERLLGQSYAYFTSKHDPRPRRRMTRKALSHLSAGFGSLITGRRTRARERFARMRGILEYMLMGRRALWANRLVDR